MVCPLSRPLYRGPVAKRVALPAGHASLRSVKKILSHIESLTSLCPLFPSARVLSFFCYFFIFPSGSSLLRAVFAGPRCSTGSQLLYREHIPLPGGRALCPKPRSSGPRQWWLSTPSSPPSLPPRPASAPASSGWRSASPPSGSGSARPQRSGPAS